MAQYTKPRKCPHLAIFHSSDKKKKNLRGSQGKGIRKDKESKPHYCFSASLTCSVYNSKYCSFWMTLDVPGFIQNFFPTSSAQIFPHLIPHSSYFSCSSVATLEALIAHILPFIRKVYQEQSSHKIAV